MKTQITITSKTRRRNLCEKLTLTIILSVAIFNLTIYAQKAELVVQTGHSNIVGATAFSPDGKYIVTGDGFAKVLILWETSSGKELRRFAGHENAILAVAFSHNGQFVASVSKDKTLRKWEILTGHELLKIDLTQYKGKIGSDESLNFLAFGEDDSTIIASTKTNISISDFQAQNLYHRTSFSGSKGISVAVSSMQVWSAVNGTLLKDERLLEPLTVSNNGKLALVWQITSLQKDNSLAGQYLIWDLAAHRPISQLKDEKIKIVYGSVKTAVFSFDDSTISTIVSTTIKSKETLNQRIRYSNFIKDSDSIEETVEFIAWNISTGQPQKRINKNIPLEKSILVQRNGEQPDKYILFSVCREGKNNQGEAGLFSVCSLDLDNGMKTEIKLDRFLGYANSIMSISASANGVFVAFGTGDSTTTIINVVNKKIVNWLTGKMPYVADVSISFNGSTISTIAEDETIMRWNLTTGQPVIEKKGEGKGKGAFEKQVDVVSSDGKMRFIKNTDGGELQKITTGKVFLLLNHPGCAFLMESIRCVQSAAFSPDNLFVATGDYKGIVRLWNVVTGNIVKTFEGHSGIVYGVAFMPDGKTLVTGSMDSTTRLWDIGTTKEKARLITAFDGSWTVITPDGLFDASPDARKLMHYVVGLEVITLEQMKDVYYIPGLLKKIFKNEPLPKVELFSKKDLFPSIEFSQPKTGQKDLTVKLTNRGGGIGQVQVLVNGKEFIKDARPANFDVNVNETTLTVNLKDAPLINNSDNKIEVVARNASGSLTNRGTSRAERK